MNNLPREEVEELKPKPNSIREEVQTHKQLGENTEITILPGVRMYFLSLQKRPINKPNGTTRHT